MSEPTWIGRTIGGRYQIEEMLGQGGMSAVYKATDPNLKRVVAVKIIHSHLSTNREFVARFELEAAAVAQLRHPNIIQVYDFNHEGGAYFIVFEFVPGESLQAWLRRLNEQGQQLEIEAAMTHTAVVADALEYAHEQNLIHRDIKPANVMMHVRGQPILMDFGIAKIVGGTQHTATGAVLGTARYMSPEQVKGTGIDHRTDIYSLGVTLFEMVSGHAPFEAESAMSMMMMHVQDPVPDVRQLRPDVPIDLARVISKALAKEPDDRFQTAVQMAAALRAVRLDSPTIAEVMPPVSEPTGTQTAVPPSIDASQPIPTTESTAATTSASPTRSQPNWVLIGGAIAILLLIVFGLSQIFGNDGDNKREATATDPASEPTAVLAVAAEVGETAVPVPRETPADLPPSATPSPVATLTETLTPVPPTNPPFLVPDGMVWLPGGQVMLGSADGRADEQPERLVSIASFFIDQFEVSNARFRACVQAGSCANGFSSSATRLGYRDGPQFDDSPVVGITWNQADGFCRFLGRRLPTEAEWEYAASGPTNFTWPWGNSFDAGLSAASSTDTEPVDSFPDGVSPFGVYNMAGNVGEWVQDSYDADFYANAPSANPVNRAASDTAVYRGGSFGSTDSALYTTSRRFAHFRTQAEVDIGFRCAADLPNTSPEVDPTATVPFEPFVRINQVVLVDGRYQADFETFGFVPNLAGQHIHFFFNTLPPEQAGVPFDVNWFIYGGTTPFTDFGGPEDMPEGATQLCALVASRDHVVTQGSGSCADLPQ